MYELPRLPYGYDALEPYIDARTMEIHHTKHHAGYVAKLNDAISKHQELKSVELSVLLKDLTRVPEDIRNTIRNNGGGHMNHSLFWNILSPQGGNLEEGELRRAIERSFHDFESFKKAFSDTALSLFGSGWVWLVITQEKKLEIVSTPNQDNPIMTTNHNPILGLDIWEHAYYLKYQNKRSDYIAAWWNVVNWKHVLELYNQL